MGRLICNCGNFQSYVELYKSLDNGFCCGGGEPWHPPLALHIESSAVYLRCSRRLSAAVVAVV